MSEESQLTEVEFDPSSETYAKSVIEQILPSAEEREQCMELGKIQEMNNMQERLESFGQSATEETFSEVNFTEVNADA